MRHQARTQLEQAISENIQGTLEEWPALSAAFADFGFDLPPDTWAKDCTKLSWMILELACDECGQINFGQMGEYPCEKCNLPKLHDVV